MATYAIGDIQGCHRELLALLAHIGFDRAHDRLWLTGDLVNRGPHSLAVLRTVVALAASATVVLGNHDLHLLGCALVPGREPRRKDTLAEVLAAPDSDQLLTWLRHQPLLHHDPTLGYTLVHAGLPPQWDLTTALACAAEVSTALRGPDCAAFLAEMYGDQPDRWDPALSGYARLRFITNSLTRIRYCDAGGHLEFSEKGELSAHSTLQPWYAVRGRASADLRIVFGHWSTLRLPPAAWRQYRISPLDTGAVWGGELSAMRLEDGVLFQVKSTTAVMFD